MEVELKQALDNLSIELQGKNENQVKATMEAFEAKFNESVENQIKAAKELSDADLEKMQGHLDAMDVKMQEQKKRVEGPKDELKALISDNFEQIKSVKKGQAVELKVVGDMTLGANLTGDQPRVYTSTVTTTPGDLVNFSDLITSFPIDGGTFTFPRSVVSEGAIATQTEGAAKSQIDYDISMIDVNTDFLAGFAVYSKKMANNLPFLENFLPMALRRDYLTAENVLFYTDLAAQAVASTVVGSANEVENIIENQVLLLANNHVANAVVVNPVQYGEILKTAGPAGTGDYSLPGVVSIMNGNVTINGVAVIPAPWVPASKYIIGNWSEAAKVVTQGLGVNFFEQDSDNVRKNNITARVEAQIGLAVFNTGAFRAGDFAAI